MTNEEIKTEIIILEKEIQTIRTALILSKINFDDGQEFRREKQQKFAIDRNVFLNQELKNKNFQINYLNGLLKAQLAVKGEVYESYKIYRK